MVRSRSTGRLSYYLLALVTVVIPLAGTVYAISLYRQQGISAFDLSLTIVMYLVTILGIELGFHRYLTHRSLKTGVAVKTLLIISGCMAAHGPPVWWAAIHRRHHACSDRQGDPHSPNLYGRSTVSFRQRLQGYWHAHIGWMFSPGHTAADAPRYAKDVFNDPTVQKIDRWYLLWIGLGLGIPALLGGLVSFSWGGAWSAFVWAGLVRLFLGHHALWWGIVCLSHLIGTRPFLTRDNSRNNLLVAIIFLGDGWHNNHHAFPGSAKVGLRWWQIDPTWWLIRLLERAGLCWDVLVPAQAAIESRSRQKNSARLSQRRRTPAPEIFPDR